MNNPDQKPTATPPDQNEMISAMFATMVIQQTNMASIFLGLAPHPQSGKIEQDLDHARFFIDQLEMIEVKTKGNLDKNEANLLKQSLTSLRLSYVEAVSKPAASSAPDAAQPATQTPAPTATPADTTTPESAAAADESRKKFSKKY